MTAAYLGRKRVYYIKPMHDTEIIWNNLSVRLFQFIRKRVEDDAVAEDLLQEAFLRIHGRMDSLLDQSKVESWIYQIARNAVIDHYRQRREIAPVPEDVPQPTYQEPDASETLGLREMIEELPEPYREALVLTEYDGLSQVELAAKLGMSISGAKSRVQRARAKLKDTLLRCCHFELDRYGRVIDYWDHCCCCGGRSRTEPA
jgi:RNA polymerase sigma-70 factor, ECF subfamily